MALAPQTKLGSYEVLSALVATDIGELRRVRDTRPRRKIVVKIFPSRAHAQWPGSSENAGGSASPWTGIESLVAARWS
jgi:hypothetical protein